MIRYREGDIWLFSVGPVIGGRRSVAGRAFIISAAPWTVANGSEPCQGAPARRTIRRAVSPDIPPSPPLRRLTAPRLPLSHPLL